MADTHNAGQFGNRNDTDERALRGAEANAGRFGSDQGGHPSEAGRRGAEAPPHESKVAGGRHRHQGDAG